MNGCNRSLQCVRAEAAGFQGFLHQYHSLRDLFAVPEQFQVSEFLAWLTRCTLRKSEETSARWRTELRS